MSNLIIEINGVQVLNNDAITVSGKTDHFVAYILRLKSICNEMTTDTECDINSIGINVIKDVFPNHGTNASVVSGHETIITFIDNSDGSKLLKVAAGQIVSSLLGSILIDVGNGTAKAFTNSSKTTEAIGSDTVTHDMVLEAKAQDAATISNYTIRLDPSDITTVSTTDTTIVSVVVNTAGAESISVISGKIVSEVLSAILVDNGEGSTKVYTDSTKTIEASTSATVTSTMVLESIAENTTTKVTYTILIV